MLKVATPIPRRGPLLLSFMDGLDTALAVESWTRCWRRSFDVRGRHHLAAEVYGADRHGPRAGGENSVESVRSVLMNYLGQPFIEYSKSLEGEEEPAPGPVPPLPVRPPVLCAGCPPPGLLSMQSGPWRY